MPQKQNLHNSRQTVRHSSSAESKLNDAQSEYDSGVAKLAEEKRKNGEKNSPMHRQNTMTVLKKPLKNSKRRIKSKMQRKKLILLQNQSGMSSTEATTGLLNIFFKCRQTRGCCNGIPVLFPARSGACLRNHNDKTN